jgi:hypothetical protein
MELKIVPQLQNPDKLLQYYESLNSQNSQAFSVHWASKRPPLKRVTHPNAVPLLCLQTELHGQQNITS